MSFVTSQYSFQEEVISKKKKRRERKKKKMYETHTKKNVRGERGRRRGKAP